MPAADMSFCVHIVPVCMQYKYSQLQGGVSFLIPPSR